MFYVYILESLQEKNQKYIGFTEDLKNRLEHHNSGASKYTAKYKPWKISFYCCFPNKKKALDFESYLKSGSGIAFRNKRF